MWPFHDLNWIQSIHVNWIRPGFLQHLFIFLLPLCYFVSSLQPNLTHGIWQELKALNHVLLTFYLLKCSGNRLIYFANIYCCFTWLHMGAAGTLINESGGCLAFLYLLELLWSLAEMISCNSLGVCLKGNCNWYSCEFYCCRNSSIFLCCLSVDVHRQKKKKCNPLILAFCIPWLWLCITD